METIGLIAAMGSESDALLRLVRKYTRFRIGSCKGAVFQMGPRECTLITSGMGRRRASAAAHLLLESIHPACMISFGIAGAVYADLHIGDVVMPTRTGLLENGAISSWSPLAELSASAWASVEQAVQSCHARLFRGTAITTTGSQLVTFDKDFPSPILEMETAGILEVVQASRIPLLVLRSISDGPQAPVPIDLGAVMDANSNLIPGKMLKELVEHPGALLHARAMLRNSRLAADHAAVAVMTALEQSGPLLNHL